MKNLNIKYLGLVTCLFLFVGCEYEGIDPITSVDPGQDEASPVITISNPPEGMVINEATELSSLEINLKVEDDIELQEIVVQVNGENVATYTEFTDYRIALKKFMYEGITFGEHTVTVTATDMDGNVTSKTVNFKKEPPYSPKYENEVFYMGFEGAYMDLLSLTTAQQTGTPGFSENSYEGARSYKGANGAYLSIPLPELGNDFTVAFWYNLNTSADRACILTATDDSDRNQGFRFFREPAPGDATKQVFKLNVGTESGDIWNDGGTIPAADSDWMHIAFTFTSEGTVIYFDGVPVRSTELSNAQVDWTGVDNLVIGSGLNFEGWGHNSDPSLIDELRLFDVALTAEEIDEMVNPDGGPLSLYLPFDGDYKDVVSDRTITVVGTPGFAGESVEGTNAYA
ncbi:LamG domain-containing protein [Antarcticibacterium sp. 1MA-6-2]|uniref:LamG domain-containing protein n=1 Tax=Antarcticibacterium sp. 1MA-6-2 TaxID=2908210 RepID=UPI001F3A8662|nr:LamG domain-containing protein [Antarcticibacterium sp. 1MA-6-2]UJH92756.1 LamG domain-containing protein [Antarcticibacterium sp. 1MA-6-2]